MNSNFQEVSVEATTGIEPRIKPAEGARPAGQRSAPTAHTSLPAANIARALPRAMRSAFPKCPPNIGQVLSAAAERAALDAGVAHRDASSSAASRSGNRRLPRW